MWQLVHIFIWKVLITKYYYFREKNALKKLKSILFQCFKSCCPFMNLAAQFTNNLFQYLRGYYILTLYKLLVMSIIFAKETMGLFLTSATPDASQNRWFQHQKNLKMPFTILRASKSN
jgi:hypothetical protein